jgi:hypothetical protein
VLAGRYSSALCCCAGREREGALRKRAAFEAATHWQYLTIRRGCMIYAFATVIGAVGQVVRGDTAVR